MILSKIRQFPVGFAAASAYKDPQDQCSSVRIFKGSDFSTTGSMDIHFSPTIRTTGYFFAIGIYITILFIGMVFFNTHHVLLASF